MALHTYVNLILKLSRLKNHHARRRAINIKLSQILQHLPTLLSSLSSPLSG